MALQNYAKFESRVASSSDSYSQTMQWWDYGLGFGYSTMRVFDTLFIALIVWMVIIGGLYGLYVLISLVRRGALETLAEMRTLGGLVASGIGNVLQAIWRFIQKIWKLGLAYKFRAFVIVVLIVGFLGSANVVNGSSRFLRIIHVTDGYVGVNLAEHRIIGPGYALYSPLTSQVFLVPTNTFDFEIAEVTANTKEELGVSIDYRVWFRLNQDKMLDLYGKFGAKNIQAVSSDIVMPKLLENIKRIIRAYSFRDISSKHDEIKAAVIAEANKALVPMGIELQDVNILDIRLPESYIKSKEDLLNAENALRLSEAELEKQKKESERAILEAGTKRDVQIVEAQGIAKYNEIVNNQPMSDKILELKRIDNERLKVEKWDGKLPTSTAGSFFMDFGTNTASGATK